MKKSDFFSMFRFLLTIIVFIGLKIWELLKFVWKITKYWKMSLYITGSIVGFLIFIFGWVYLIELQVEYFNVYNSVVITVNTIVLIISIIVGASIYNNWYFVSKFFADNWREAKRIVNKRRL